MRATICIGIYLAGVGGECSICEESVDASTSTLKSKVSGEGVDLPIFSSSSRSLIEFLLRVDAGEHNFPAKRQVGDTHVNMHHKKSALSSRVRQYRFAASPRLNEEDAEDLGGVSVADLCLTMDDLNAPLPSEFDGNIQASGYESTSQVNDDQGCEWTESSNAIEATLTIPGLRGQPADAIAVELTQGTVTVTAFGMTVWSCLLRGEIDVENSYGGASDGEGMLVIIRLKLQKKTHAIRWGGLIGQIGVDSVLQ